MRLKSIRNRVVRIYNDLVLLFFGRIWKIILINEYPKCGASWLKLMIGEILHQEGYFINRKKIIYRELDANILYNIIV